MREDFDDGGFVVDFDVREGGGCGGFFDTGGRLTRVGNVARVAVFGTVRG